MQIDTEAKMKPLTYLVVLLRLQLLMLINCSNSVTLSW